MAVPARYQRLFLPYLQAGEEVRAAANADLWLRYRRLALTDRRLLCVERGGLRRPWGGARMSALPLAGIRAVTVQTNPLQTTLTIATQDGSTVSYALPTISRSVTRFIEALRTAIGDGAVGSRQ